jgi:hypothetical protein
MHMQAEAYRVLHVWPHDSEGREPSGEAGARHRHAARPTSGERALIRSQ